MSAFPYSREQLAGVAKFSDQDLQEIKQRRQDYNRLGFGYQLSFVRLLNRFPVQEPLEIIDEVLAFVSHQLGITDDHIQSYGKRRKTVSEHQETIRHYGCFCPNARKSAVGFMPCKT